MRSSRMNPARGPLGTTRRWASRGSLTTEGQLRAAQRRLRGGAPHNTRKWTRNFRDGFSAAVHGLASGAGIRLSPVPRPDTVDLDLQREAEEDSDHDDDAEDRDAFERRVDDDRPDDVSDDQYFQSQQDAAAQRRRLG